MLDVWREFARSKKWQAIAATVATIWGGVLGGAGSVREGVIGTAITILTGVAAQGAADVGKSAAKINAGIDAKAIRDSKSK